MNTTRSQAALDNLKPTTFTVDDVCDGNLDVDELDLAVTLGSIIVSKNVHWAHDLDTRGIRRNNDDRLLAVLALVVGVALTHDQVDLAAGVTGTGDPPLVTVDDVVVPDALDASLNVGSIRGGNSNLGHGKS